MSYEQISGTCPASMESVMQLIVLEEKKKKGNNRQAKKCKESTVDMAKRAGRIGSIGLQVGLTRIFHMKVFIFYFLFFL